MTRRELDTLADAIAVGLKEGLGPIVKRIAALEARPAGLKYVGIWDGSDSYAADEAVTHNGSLWIAREPSRGVRPGDGRAWQLAVKRGKDARG